jgi:DNA-binding transcriptional LysR family regulator
VDVRILKTLVAVAEHGTFAAAANVMGLSPSAVSMKIQVIEQHLAAELFPLSGANEKSPSSPAML